MKNDLKIQLNVTNIFDKNLKSTKRYVVNRGGGGSSKTVSILQVLIHKFIEEEKKRIIIIRKTLPSLRDSSHTAFIQLLEEMGIYKKIYEEKQYLNYHYKNNEIRFRSLDNPDKIKCFHPDTEILTKEGFKFVEKIKVGNLVASFNPITKEACYVPVTNVWAYDYNGKIYTNKNKIRPSIDFCVTKEHKFIGSRRINVGTKYRNKYIKGIYEFKKIKEFPHRFYIPVTAKWGGNNIDYYKIPKNNYKYDGRASGRKTTKFAIKPFLRFLGWFISKGNFSSNHTIKITPKNEKIKKILIEDLKALNYGFSEFKEAFAICGKDLYNYLLSFGKFCHEKRIPRDILDLHPTLLKYLFGTLMLGGGTVVINKNGTKKWTYSTTSEKLKESISELSIKLGLKPTVKNMKDYVKNNPEKFYKNAKSYWVIHISEHDEIDINRNRIEEKNYRGKVYCLEAPPFHTVMSRYNGRIMWIGQSANYSYIFLEEANDFTYQDFAMIDLYLREPSVDGKKNQIFLAFNPIDENHWLKTKLIDVEEDLEEIHSTYKDNPFLPDDHRIKLEQLINRDPNLYRIYTLGEWGRETNLVYKNWQRIANIPKNEIEAVCYGLDFGFNDPTVLIKIYQHKENKNKLYLEELIYKTKLITKNLIDKLNNIIKDEDRYLPIYADSAEPDRIQDLKRAGFNIKPSRKGKNSVKDGIDFVKKFDLYIPEDSVNLLKEIQSYSWRIDRDNDPIDIPIDYNNHCVDSFRMAIYTGFKKFKTKFRWL